ncbi:Cro/CI family transcriptional regulator [Achromobacter sp. DH1f]|uniref:Cro/CI family transcriptional regulator n=1 Tax=Achromobacter sp. DH1f TaxID=1397275 RepID=UPI00046A835A|nr:Cro/CI family transcriptional regulator [Achromobacter sp. DH1f]
MTDTEIIDALGGTGEAARLFEVTTGAISQWRTKGIPKARLQFLKLARPDLFAPAPSPEPAHA